MRIHTRLGLGLYLGLFLIVSCSSGGGGGSGSSAPRYYPIPAIHGMWLEADRCNCKVNRAAEPALEGTKVRCYHYFAPSGGKTRAASGYIRFDNMGDACDNALVLTSSQQQAMQTIRTELSKLIARDVAFFLPPSELPDGVGSVVYATATMRNGSDIEVMTGPGFGDRPGKALDFLYTNNVAKTLGTQPGGKGIVCSSYWKRDDENLYMGVPGARHEQSCSPGRYTTVERYIKVP